MINRFMCRLWPDEATPALPWLLLALTLVTGIVDSISYVMLGHVFVANMTGNVAFIGLAAAGANISFISTLISLACFLVGAFVGGKLAKHCGKQRFTLLLWATLFMLVPLVITFVLSIVWNDRLHTNVQYIFVALLAVAMGIQGAAARAVAAADLTTLVLTTTLVTLVTDTAKTFKNAGTARRLLSVTTMATGAATGTLFTVNNNMTVPLGIILMLVAAVVVASYVHRPRQRNKKALISSIK